MKQNILRPLFQLALLTTLALHITACLTQSNESTLSEKNQPDTLEQSSPTVEARTSCQASNIDSADLKKIFGPGAPEQFRINGSNVSAFHVCPGDCVRTTNDKGTSFEFFITDSHFPIYFSTVWGNEFDRLSNKYLSFYEPGSATHHNGLRWSNCEGT